jgi:hypothetical protein
MTYIDFVVGFLLLMSSIFFVVYFVSNSISNNANDVSKNSLSESSVFLENYLFSENSNVFVHKAYDVQLVLTETSSSSHTDEIAFSIEPKEDVRLYDGFWNETSSNSTQLSDRTEVRFTTSFSPNEKKTLMMVYFGSETQNISYMSVDNNVSFLALAGKEIGVVPSNVCSDAAPYDELKNRMDFNHDFRVEILNCSYGREKPSKTNIFVLNVPLLVQNSEGLVESSYAKLMIW